MKLEKYAGKLERVYLFSYRRSMANVTVLAVYTAKGTAAKENSARAANTADRRLLEHMKLGTGYASLLPLTANAPLPRVSVGTAKTGTEIAFTHFDTSTKDYK